MRPLYARRSAWCRPAPWLALALCLGARPAAAHQSSVVYLVVGVEQRDVRVRLDIANSDLYEAVGAERERPISRDEARAHSRRLVDYVAAHVTVSNDGQPCPVTPHDLTLADKSDGFFAVVQLDYTCKRTAQAVALRYDLFFDLDGRHQGLARVQLDGQPERQVVLRAGGRVLELTRPVTLAEHLRDYLVLGMEHIFTGYDHLAFLFGLLLVAAARGLRRGLRYVLGIVTAFTLAHSVTLIAAGLGWLRLSPRLVEPAIALSIAYVAVENLVVREPKRRWLLTFAFGLVHGFGFASVLQEIGLPPRGVVPSLVAFNVGVELGQLCVVAAVAPVVLWWVPRAGGAQRLRVVGSAVLLVLGSYWFFERMLGASWLGGWLG